MCEPKAIIVCENVSSYERVYSGGRRDKLKRIVDLYPTVINNENLEVELAQICEAEYIFSTWGMPEWDEEIISKFPHLKAVFYAAGSVQSFARPFLNSGVRVMSAWAANAVPVAEYTQSQVQLALNGFFHHLQFTKSPETFMKAKELSAFPGCFDVEVSLLGAGMIGRMVIERCQELNLKVLVYDPFMTEQEAQDLNVEKVELEEAFERGFVVSNHLANLPETVELIKARYLNLMPRGATFINTGRGATIEEQKMAEVFAQRPDLVGLLDVTISEPPKPGNKLYALPNVFLTPHIAGSLGQEVWRMADYAITAAEKFMKTGQMDYDVTLEMLVSMA